LVLLQPKIVAIAGPLAGSSFTLPEREGCVGRAPYNWLTIKSATISRQHFFFELTEGGWKLTDLDSHNGTFVNDTPVRERLLVNGDHLRAGDSHFVFVTEEEDLDQDAPTSHDTMVHTRTVMSLESDSSFLQPVSPRASQAEQRLNALLRISAEIQSAQSLDELRREVAARVLEVLPSERVEIYLRDQPGTAPVAVEAMKMERSILAEDSGREVMAAPLMVSRQVRGAIYVVGKGFTKEHLDLTAAVATFIALAVDSLGRIQQLQADNKRLQDESGLVHEMVGESAAMERVYQVIQRVAPMDTTVLILGENGTGKELAARAVHRNSARKLKPFVAINCATLKETLLESELFGHERGAFTGAVAQKVGKIELASGGTLFLDEIAELELGLQAKLLRVLQELEYERLGGTKTLKADIRIIAASNRDLKEYVKSGLFREDLFYRLNVVSLTMPPLRGRRDDIPLLASHFVNRFAEKCARRIEGISGEAKLLMLRYEWPGNVRELQNTIERAVVLGSSEMIQVEDLPESILEGAPEPNLPLPAYHAAVQDAKRRQILDAINQAQGNISEAARNLGVHPNYLHRLVTKLGLRGELARGA
jgi:Nif-specific regulatory protein